MGGRLLEPIGQVPPAEFEKAYYLEAERGAQARISLASGTNPIPNAALRASYEPVSGAEAESGDGSRPEVSSDPSWCGGGGEVRGFDRNPLTQATESPRTRG